MRRYLLAGAVGVWLLAGCNAAGAPASPIAAHSPPGVQAATAVSPTATREPAHDFTLATLDGGSVTLSELRGQWVIVNFWASWCGPCVREMAYLSELAATRDLVVLGVNFHEDAETVAAFVAEHGITFPTLLEPDDITELMYEVRGLPRTVVIAPDGTIATRVVGEIQPERFDAWLDANQIARK